MKIFLYLSLIKIYFSLDFNPLPKENGILNSQYAHNTTNNLYFIFEHFRHGARSPCNGGFIDYKDDLGGKWDNYGSLTKLGAKQHYLLGLRNRKYYDGFISREYNSNEIRVYCSNYNRTMMSAQAQLLGFYNKIDFKNIQKNDDIIGEEKISNKVNLQGIIPPINLFLNMQEDKQKFEIAFREKFKCPFLKEMIEKNIKNIDKLETFNKLNNIKEKIVSNYLGIILKEFEIKSYPVNYTTIYTFCDIFICSYFDEENNKKRFYNIEKKYKNFNSTELLGICYNYLFEKFYKVEGAEYSKENSVITMSKILKSMINFMELRINKSQEYIGYESPKFVLYSGHDDTLTQIQLFLNQFFNINLEWVPFASNQIFEIRKYGNTFYVEVYYNEKLKMNITFNEFSEIIKKSIMSEVEIEKKCYGFIRSPYFLRIFILILLFIFMIIFFIVMKIYYCYKNESLKINKPPKIVLVE